MLTLNDFFMYFGVAWVSNICLNLLGTLKMYSNSLEGYDIPIDFYKKMADTRLVGDSITLLGLAICFIIAVIFFVLTGNMTIGSIPILVYFGGLIGSFIKRRLRIPDGQHLMLIDHGDYMILTGLVLCVLQLVTLDLAVYALLLTYVLHPLFTYTAYKVGLRKSPL